MFICHHNSQESSPFPINQIHLSFFRSQLSPNMAYAVLVSLAQTIDLVLNNDKYSISDDEREIFSSIREYVKFLTSFFEDFPEKANRLEGKIRDAANEAEDIIETFMWKEIRLPWLWFELSRDDFERQLKEIREKICLIAGELMDDRPCDLPAAISSSRLAPTRKNDMVIGLDEDLMAIKRRLCGESPTRQVIPIVGMGGIGKTTLARSAYDDLWTVEYFHIRAWVTVSQDYTAQKVLSGLLDSLKPFIKAEFEKNKEMTMGEKVYKTLMGMKYLIVLDDIWSEEAWDDVRILFPNDNNGSRIMLTTRLSDVATNISPSSPLHELQFMNEDQSWNLLKQKVFIDGQDCFPHLENVGKEIARKCGGLPLAVVLVAGILSSANKTRASWEKFAGNVNSIVDWQLKEILSLSYKNLPHHLRPCFLYIGGFPGGYKVPVWRLIKLWVAGGFLKHENGNKSLEEVAEEYLEDLVKRSLVLVTSRKTNGKIKNCSVHDLVREFCMRKAHEEKFLLHGKNSDDLPKGTTRGIIFSPHLDLGFLSQNIRTFVCFLDLKSSSSLAFLGKFRLLRELEVITDFGFSLPPEVFELIHLRYLALGAETNVSSDISKLKNLQTLMIRPKMRIIGFLTPMYLPLAIWRLPHLRHLVCINSYMLPEPRDSSTLPLKNLQTLSVVLDFVCSQSMLKMIPHLKKLGIYYSWRGDDPLHYRLNLIDLHHLEKLKIAAFESFPWQGINPAFPKTLKNLTLMRGGLPWKDMIIVGSLPNLEILKLRDMACTGKTWETTDGHFPQLKFLQIEKSHLRDWKTESGSHFPTLKCLVLHHCWDLSGIPDAIGEIPTLEMIEVDDQNRSLVRSAKQIQEDQKENGYDGLQVRCIHSDKSWCWCCLLAPGITSAPSAPESD